MNNDCFKIYGNKNIKNTLTSMIDCERLWQVFLIYGLKGLGKKEIAKYMAAKILCSNQDKSPCGECKNCKMIYNNAHPDVEWIIKTSTNKAFSVENLRSLNIDSRISANEGDKKVYIIPDCDSMSPLAQNVFLKLIEDTPKNVYFIFTATSKAVFIPTILSRVISLAASEVTKEDCEEALSKIDNVDSNQIQNAINAFGGNIGMCKDFLFDDKLKTAVQIAKDITDSLCEVSEYKLFKAINQTNNDKEMLKNVITLFLSIIRDSCTIRIGNSNLIGCYKEGSEKLSKILSLRQSDEIYKIFTTTNAKLNSNANFSLTLAYMSAMIKKVI